MSRKTRQQLNYDRFCWCNSVADEVHLVPIEESGFFDVSEKNADDIDLRWICRYRGCKSLPKSALPAWIVAFNKSVQGV